MKSRIRNALAEGKKHLDEEAGEVWGFYPLAVLRCAYFLLVDAIKLFLRVLTWATLWSVGRALPWPRLQKGRSDLAHHPDLQLTDATPAEQLDQLLPFSEAALERAHERREFVMGKAAQVLTLNGAVFVVLGLSGDAPPLLRPMSVAAALASTLLCARTFGPIWWADPRLEPHEVGPDVKRVVIKSNLTAAQQIAQTVDVVADTIAAAVNLATIATILAGVALLVSSAPVTLGPAKPDQASTTTAPKPEPVSQSATPDAIGLPDGEPAGPRPTVSPPETTADPVPTDEGQVVPSAPTPATTLASPSSSSQPGAEPTDTPE